MAAKLEGGAYLSSFVDVVLEKLSSVLEDNDSLVEKNNLLEKLEKSLYDVGPVLDDAEQKQFTDKKVKKWLVDFQDALYLVDDLLDKLSTEAATATQRDRGNSSSWSHLVDSYIEDSGDIEKIVGTLESVVRRKNYLRLRENAKMDMSWRTPSTCLVESSDIFGRDEDKGEIIKLLLDDTCDVEFPVTAIPVVGMGGIGKTTLAQLVYSDAKIVEKFDIRAWVCVAENFDPVNLTRIIVEKIISPCPPLNTYDFDLLQTHLKEALTGKKFLVVLDDVWHDQQVMWENFLKPFRYGNNGSKILLTTRSKKVASVFAATNLQYQLSLLSDEDCWSMFLKHSSLSTNSSQYAILEQIGRHIVEKCKRLPLAIKTLGCLLRNNYDEGIWEEILKSEIWELSENDSLIVPALRISYHYLPSHLKRCFVHCSLYHDDYEFRKDELILLWMAEDLLQPMKHNTLENIGRTYFDELVSRSFFQPSSTNASLFVMHDLMHDLATFFAEKFYFRVNELSNPHNICSKTRHVSYNSNSWDPIPKFREAYDGAMHIRTFLYVYLHNSRNSTDFGRDSWLFLPQLKCLRVLSFVDSHMKSLPDSIGDLIHLRYLDLSFTLVERLPESLCELYNLQTLKLRLCRRLRMLPNRMQDLVNLRHLDIKDTLFLEEMPKGMSKLKHLNLLERYIVGKKEENGIRELGTLDNLHGSFRISNLENVKNCGEALEAKMGNKKHINILELKWLPDDDIADVETERDILDELEPHGNLKELSIDGYRGETFPDWLGLSSYSNMTKLTLVRCKNCRQLPSLGQLPSLQHLRISSLHRLERIGLEFYKKDESSLETPFKSLQSLEFLELSCWREWHIPDEFDSFPQLKRLSIVECPALIGNLPAHLPDLELLNIWKCEELSCSLPTAPKLLQLRVTDSWGGWSYLEEVKHPQHVLIQDTQLAKSVLEWLSHTQRPRLRRLRISQSKSGISISAADLPDSLQHLVFGGSKLRISEPLQHKSLTKLVAYKCDTVKLTLGYLPNLRSLTIDECENVECLVVAKDLPSLGKLSITDCPRLESLPALSLIAPQVEEMEIWYCPEIDSFSEEFLPPSLRMLQIYDCQKLARSIASKGLQSEGLIHLSLGQWNEINLFPREDCLPASLQSLELHGFPNLETLDCKGIQHLRELSIQRCPKLENITQENLPASITKLHVPEDCPFRRKLEEMNDPRIQSET